MKRERLLRWIALAAAGLLVLSLFCASLYLIHHAEHDCTGKDCEICRNLEACVHQLGLNAPQPANGRCAAASPALYTAGAVGLLTVLIVCSTPVKRKEKNIN